MFICIYPSKILSRILFRVCVCVFTYSTIRFHSYKLLSISTEHAHCTTIYGNRFFIDKLVQTLYTMTTKPAQICSNSSNWMRESNSTYTDKKKKLSNSIDFPIVYFAMYAQIFRWQLATITTNKRLKKCPSAHIITIYYAVKMCSFFGIRE